MGGFVHPATSRVPTVYDHPCFKLHSLTPAGSLIHLPVRIWRSAFGTVNPPQMAAHPDDPGLYRLGPVCFMAPADLGTGFQHLVQFCKRPGALFYRSTWRAAGSLWFTQAYPSTDRPYNVPRIVRALEAAGIAMALYSLATGLIVPAVPFFPGNWLNNDTFTRYLLVPIQLIRALIGLAIAATTIRFLEYSTSRYPVRSRPWKSSRYWLPSVSASPATYMTVHPKGLYGRIACTVGTEPGRGGDPSGRPVIDRCGRSR